MRSKKAAKRETLPHTQRELMEWLQSNSGPIVRWREIESTFRMLHLRRLMEE